MAITEVAVFAPSTTLSVTLERTADSDELHVHPAGQGVWVARMLAILRDRPVLCTPMGGETGSVLRALLGRHHDDGFVDSSTPNGAYVHDRRSGERQVIAELSSAPLDRHCLDDLVSATLGCGLHAGTVVVCGSNLHGNVAPNVFTRLCADLRSGGATVVADLSGDELSAALAGGVDVLKISHQEMVDGGWSSGPSTTALRHGIKRLVDAGAEDVVVSRAEEGALAFVGGVTYLVTSPTLSVVDHRGAGDSMTAGLAHAAAHAMEWPDGLRLAAAAAALNVTRHGLASGRTEAISQLADQVVLTELPTTAAGSAARRRGAGAAPARAPRGAAKPASKATVPAKAGRGAKAAVPANDAKRGGAGSASKGATAPKAAKAGRAAPRRSAGKAAASRSSSTKSAPRAARRGRAAGSG